MRIFPPHATDFYKTGHIRMNPEGTEFVYSNFTPRSDKLAQMLHDFDHKVVFFGLQGVIQWMLIDLWRDRFFSRPKAEVVQRYRRRMDSSLGPGAVNVDHIAALHDLGYLPLAIKALPEGSRVPMRVPVFTVVNTHPAFGWLTNYIESAVSAECWKAITTATTAYEFRRMLDQYADDTGSPKDFVRWQGHDFSMRGMSGIHDAMQSGAGHLLSFAGTDTISAIDYHEEYYGGQYTFVGGSVPATEHSVMCFGGREHEIDTYRRLLEIYPSGIVSIVSDTWNFWDVLTKIAPALKAEILARKPDVFGLAKTVFRPDSGDPVKIICGDPEAPAGSPERAGAIQLLWDQFGGTETAKGYKLLNPRVGLIYGDAITLDRAQRILRGLADRGFASGNVVFGIGSFSYQHATRDTFGHAYKATWGVVNGVPRELYKDPATDSGSKRSARGLLRVELENGEYVLHDQQTPEQEQRGELRLVFRDGVAYQQQTLSDIRARLIGTNF